MSTATKSFNRQRMKTEFDEPKRMTYSHLKSNTKSYVRMASISRR